MSDTRDEMRDFEDALRERLARRAAAVDMRPDADDLDARLARVGRRRTGARNVTAVLAAAAAVLVVVAIAGVVLGSRRSDVTTTSTTTPTSTTPATPTTMPVPGGVDRARAAIANDLTTVFQPGASDRARLALIEPSDGLGAVIARVRTAAPSGTLATVRVRVDDVRFTLATVAAVDYTITSTDTTHFPGERRFRGGAVFVDGRWKMTRTTFCQTIAAGGVYCPEDAPAPSTMISG